MTERLASQQQRDKERRKLKRHQLRCSVELCSLEGDYLGRVVNIHLQGFMCYGVAEIDTGDRISALLNLTKNVHGYATVELAAKCVWRAQAMSEDPAAYWYGFQIVELSPTNWSTLETIIEQESF
jgi:hypothetical protein